ncbi:MAG: 4a-hydroxytetrahydrobiopterin dehydratase [Phycisphaerales bacterium]
MAKMKEDQIEAALEKRPDWSNVAGKIQRTYQFGDFVASMAFVNKIAEYAERVQHHPDVLIRYNRVTLTVSTHDAGGITQKDFDLAEESDRLAG